MRIVPDISIKQANELLKESELSLIDESHTSNLRLIGAYDSGHLIGLVGLEQINLFGLLRSLYVLPRFRERSRGSMLVNTTEQLARKAHIKQVFLFTENAASFFEDIGYIKTSRDSLPEAIRCHRQNIEECSSQADVLFRYLFN